MRNYKPSKMWGYSRAEIFTTELDPVKYYMEDEMFIEDIEPMLQDATMDEFIELYKQYRRNYFKHNSKLVFYTNGAYASNIFLLFNDNFFTHFKEDKYYVRTSSFKTLASYLVKEHYPNEIAYSKAVNYVARYGPNGFDEGRNMISFKFHIVQND
jgi:hypothetical protein